MLGKLFDKFIKNDTGESKDKKIAILLLPNKGLEYIRFFCSQFANDEHFNIYINFNNTKLSISKDEIDELKNKYRNIKLFSDSYSDNDNANIMNSEIYLINYALFDDELNNTFILCSDDHALIHSIENTYYLLYNQTTNYYNNNQWFCITREFASILSKSYYDEKIKFDGWAKDKEIKYHILFFSYIIDNLKKSNQHLEFNLSNDLHFTDEHSSPLVISNYHQYIRNDIYNNAFMCDFDFNNDKCIELYIKLKDL